VGRRLTLAILLVALLAAPAAALGFGSVFRQVPGNPADRLTSQPIEGYSYDYATRCLKHPQAGTEALASWLGRHAGGSSWGIMRCEKWGPHSASLHAEGRALDWHLSVHSPAERREAERIIDLLLAPDRLGNIHALARRMGVQEIIWNCQGWFSGDGGMRPYSVCFDKHGRRKKVDDTSAHRDHVHIGLNWAGARMRSSFWRSQAARR
jgi:hypothetical protein